MLGHAARAGLTEAEATLSKLAQQGVVPQRLRLPHPRFGTFTDTAAAAVLLAILASGGRVSWLAAAYGIGVAWTLRLQSGGSGPSSHAIAGSDVPDSGDAAHGRSRMAARLVADRCVRPPRRAGDASPAVTSPRSRARSSWPAWRRRSRCPRRRATEASEPNQRRTSSSWRPTTPHWNNRRRDPAGCSSPSATRTRWSTSPAPRCAGDRDVVVMTARLLGVDGEYEELGDSRPTSNERVLFSTVVAMAERHGRRCGC